MTKPTKLLIVDDNAFLRLGLCTAVGAAAEVEVIGELSPNCEVVADVERLKPDVVLMSMRSPDFDGVLVCRKIKARIPSTKVVFLSYQEHEKELLHSVLAGASGYVSKSGEMGDLLRAIRIAACGSSYFDRDTAERVVINLLEVNQNQGVEGALDLLTNREIIILRMISEGYVNREIGQRLNLATNTVRNNITKLRAKLGLRSRAELITYAMSAGITSHYDRSSEFLKLN